MAKNKQADRLAFEARIIAEATSFRVHLFLGRGQFDRAEAATPAEALALAAAMKAAHPEVSGKPLIYAIEPSGHSALIPQREIIEMEKQTSKSPAALRMAALRAKRKADAEASRQEVKAIKAERKAEAGEPGPQGLAAMLPKLGGKTTPRPAKAPQAAPKAAQGRKPNGKAPEAPQGKRAAILAAAQAGKAPPKPDFSAETHKRFRPRLDQVHEMVLARDLKGLKAFKWEGFMSSSPKAVMKYRDLAIVALEAQAAAKGAPPPPLVAPLGRIGRTSQIKVT